jgi:O-antigen ligase
MPLPRLTTPDYLVIAMAVWFLFRAATAGEPAKGISPFGTWLFYVMLPAVIYGLVRIGQPTTGDAKLLVTLLIGLAAYTAVIGFFEVRGWYSLVFPRYIVNPKVWEFFGRARGPLMNPSANGVLLTMGLSFAALRAYHGDRLAKMGYGIVVLVMLLGIYATLTRIVWIGGFAALVVIFWTPTPRWAKTLGLAAVVLLGGMAAMGLKDQILNLKRDKALSAQDSAKSVKLRPLLAIVAYEMFKDRPVLGHGFGVYKRASKPYFHIRSYGMPLEECRGYFQHNIILSVLVDTGIIGLTICSWLFVHWTRTAWRLGHTIGGDPVYRVFGLGAVGTIVGYFAGGMLQDVILMPMIQMYLFFFGAMIVSLYQTSQETAARSDSRGRSGSRVCDLAGAIQWETSPAASRFNDSPYPAGTPVADGAFQPAT